MTGRVLVTTMIAGAGTYVIRVAFFAMADRTDRMPDLLRRSLRYIPGAALAALAVPPLLRPHGGGLDPLHPITLAGVVAGLVAFRTRSVALTVAVGLVAAMLLDLALPGSVSSPRG